MEEGRIPSKDASPNQDNPSTKREKPDESGLVSKTVAAPLETLLKRILAKYGRIESSENVCQKLDSYCGTNGDRLLAALLDWAEEQHGFRESRWWLYILCDLTAINSAWKEALDAPTVVSAVAHQDPWNRQKDKTGGNL